jgi:Zn-finger nucleic acid-binding protein
VFEPDDLPFVRLNVPRLDGVSSFPGRSIREEVVDCPKCGNRMETVSHRDIEVDRCTNCRGIWFDNLEREKLEKLSGSESIDIGDAETGERYDRVERIDCPVCSTRMLRMVDPAQPHVWYEACKVCNGVFLDAGEFKDLKELTLLDRLRALFPRERK